jgi:predicted  nucleic acid-binding Zn-ribbon protein
MLRDLESLIQLQELDNNATTLRVKIDTIPTLLKTLNDDVTARANEVDNAKKRFEEHKIERQNSEND